MAEAKCLALELEFCMPQSSPTSQELLEHNQQDFTSHILDGEQVSCIQMEKKEPQLPCTSIFLLSAIPPISMCRTMVEAITPYLTL
jgi:hypothetical protein